MLISELSKKTGLSAHTIRFYEKSGLIRGKRDQRISSNNYFRYSESDIDRLQLIQDAKSVGFTLAEISALIDAWEGDKIPKQDKLKILDDKLEFLDKQIIRIQQMQELIQEFKQSIEEEAC